MMHTSLAPSLSDTFSASLSGFAADAVVDVCDLLPVPVACLIGLSVAAGELACGEIGGATYTGKGRDGKLEQQFLAMSS